MIMDAHPASIESPKHIFLVNIEGIERLWHLEPGTLDKAFATLRGRPFDSFDNLTEPVRWDQDLLDVLHVLANTTNEINLAVTRIGRAVAKRVEQDPSTPYYMTAADVLIALESFELEAEPARVSQSPHDDFAERGSQEGLSPNNVDPEPAVVSVMTAHTCTLDPSTGGPADTSNEILLGGMVMALDLNDMAEILPGDLQPLRCPGGPTTRPRGIITALRTFFLLVGTLRDLHEQLRVKIDQRLEGGQGRSRRRKGKQGGATIADVEAVRDWLRAKRQEEEGSASHQTSEETRANSRAEFVTTNDAQDRLQDDDDSVVSKDKTQWIDDLSQDLDGYLAQHQDEMTPASGSTRRKRPFEAVD
ncbi:hypothetical protein E8E11_001710 [Didymella keratinophila]|nr:hypothetical protein E8E11_001710 [Didymella keratinophila]